jgi:hypothetical protein
MHHPKVLLFLLIVSSTCGSMKATNAVDAPGQATAATEKIPTRSSIRSASEFGVRPGGDSPPAKNQTAKLINAAYQKAIDGNFSISFEPGIYWLEEPIRCFRVRSGKFVQGDLPALVSAAASNPSAGIGKLKPMPMFIATHNLPAIITQGGVGFYMRDIWIRRLKTSTAKEFDAAKLVDQMIDHRLWNGEELRHTRYSPTCCIAIDPFGAKKEDQYPGLDEFYGLTPGFSSGCKFDGCKFSHSRIGVLFGVGVDSNTDGITLRDCTLSDCKYGVVTCHAQTQNIMLERCVFSKLWCVAANSVHGAKNGRMPAIISPSNSSWIANVFGGEEEIRANGELGETPYALIHPDSPITFHGNGSRWEVIGRLIHAGQSGARGSVDIANASFDFVDTGRAHIKSGRMTLVRDCEFMVNGDTGATVHIESDCLDRCPEDWGKQFREKIRGSEMTFQRCLFSASGNPPDTVSKVISFGKQLPEFRDWILFQNCVAHVGDSSNSYQCSLNNIRGGEF